MKINLTKDQSKKNKGNKTAKVLKLNTRFTRRMEMKLAIERKKSTMIASVVSLVAIVTLLNQNLISQNVTEEHASRQIASVGELKIKAWKEGLLNELAQKPNRDIASYGEGPSALDQLRIGALEGKYSFVIRDNIIEEIRFIESIDGDRPKSFRNYISFISEFKKAFNAEIDRVVEVASESAEDQTMITFEAYNEALQPSGKIFVTADSANRLLGIRYTQN